MKNIYSFKTTPDSIMSKIGGKGSSLVKLTRLGLPVPQGYVIGKDATDAEKENLINELQDKYTYAVRSSALNEDGDAASFAGQYETITDVAKNDVISAINTVTNSANSERVREYTENMNSIDSGIGIVVQRFVKPEFAGVVFTSDIITGSSATMVGNYVKGEGEALVSGSKNAESFTWDAMKYEYKGNEDIKRYAKKLYNYCKKIRDSYGCPMDIEWAVSEGKVYILQARPITTLKRINDETFDLNGTRAGEYLLTKTNVGEIFMSPVSPMTYSALEKINNMLGLPAALDFINGQAYMNISVLCSMQISLGVSEEKAFANIKDLVGNLPDDVKVPVFPFDRKKFLKNLRKILFGGKKSKLSKKEKTEMVQNLANICRDMIKTIRGLQDNNALYSYWNDVMMPSLYDGLSAVLAECGMQMVPLFSTRNKITKIAGEDMANRLCGGGVGTLDSMKPLLMLEDVIEGRVTEEEYIQECGQRCAGEMELSSPKPYEDPTYLSKVLQQHRESGMNMHKMREQQEKEYVKALAEFEEKYPEKKAWINKEMSSFIGANQFREEIRSKGVWIFCVLREFLLSVGRVNGIGDDVFLLYMDEMLSLIAGDDSVIKYIDSRRANVEKNKSYPTFPSLVCGRFDPDGWVQDPNRRMDYYIAGSDITNANSDVKGFPGAAGIVEGIARVITDIDHIHELQKGEILVTCATNIGWTIAFPKVAAIVTDIGAPLSHAAIVAREFGIPAVVGCGNATTVIKSGDRIRVDGASGGVTLLQ